MRSLRKATMLRIGTGAAVLLAGAALIGAGWWGSSAWGDGPNIDPAGGKLYICRVEAPPPEITVYLRDDATQAEIQAISAEIGNYDEIEFVAFVSKADAFEEFKERYKDQPEFYENLPEDALPASFRVELAEGSDAEELSQQLQTLSATDDVRYSDPDKRPCLPIEPYDG